MAPGAWYTCVLILAITSLVYWQFAPSSDASPSSSRWLSFAAAVLPSYAALQIIPLPLPLVRMLSPARAHLAEAAAPVLPGAPWTPLSVARPVTSAYLLQAVAFVVAFFLIRELAWRLRPWWPWAPLIPLVVIGAAEAWAGWQQNADGGTVSGTYLNKDHFAGLLEMVFPGAAACGIAFSVPYRIGPRPLLRALTGAAFLLATTAIFVAIIYSLAKMGFLATLCGLFLVGALELNARARPGRRWIGIATAAVIVLALLVFLPPEQVVAALSNAFVDDTTGEGRLPIWANTLHLIAAYPVFGVGLGNYASAFPKYQTSLVDSAFTFAHNDYLQLASELGIPVFLVLAASIVTVFRRAWRAAASSTDPKTHYLALACVGGMTAIGIHSLADFNMYVPANAMVLVWLAALSAALPPTYPVPAGSRAQPSSLFPKIAAMALSLVLAIFSSAWLLFLQRGFKDHADSERQFCRFGICDIDSVLAAEKAASGAEAKPAPLADLMEAARRDPASAGRWSDLGAAFLKTGQLEQARKCFENALALGPNIPPVLLDAANFHHETGDDPGALALTSRALAQTTVFRTAIFDWFADTSLPVSDVLAHGLPSDPDVFRSYFENLIASAEPDNITQAWTALSSRGYADDKTVQDYTNFLIAGEHYESAATVLAAYLGPRDPGYLKSNWIFNGGFESDFSRFPFEWSLHQGDGVESARDSDVRHSGKYSLRIHFTGEQNLADAHLYNRAFVPPGRYHFEVWVKTDQISTDQGVRIRISDPAAPSRLELKSEPLLGTHDWKKISENFCVGASTKLVEVRVTRQPSLKFDSLLKGTLWIDDVTLTKIGQSCFPGAAL